MRFSQRPTYEEHTALVATIDRPDFTRAKCRSWFSNRRSSAGRYHIDVDQALKEDANNVAADLALAASITAGLPTVGPHRKPFSKKTMLTPQEASILERFYVEQSNLPKLDDLEDLVKSIGRDDFTCKQARAWFSNRRSLSESYLVSRSAPVKQEAKSEM